MMLRHDLAGAYADADLSPMEMDAVEWLDGFYSLEHLLAARSWVVTLQPDAGADIRFAALMHDAERFVPGGPVLDMNEGPADPGYLFAHSSRSARVVDEWLAARPEGTPAFRNKVRSLILRHELGGDSDEDLVQAADSLAFLSAFDWLVVEWVVKGVCTPEQAQAKLDWMFCRIRLQKARALALPIYRESSQMLAHPDAYPIDLTERRAMAGDLGLLLGRKSQHSQPAASMAQSNMST